MSSTAIRALEVIPSSAGSTVHTRVLQAGFGAVWAATTTGLIRLSVPDASPTVVVNEPIDDVALSATSVFALAGARMELLEIDPGSLKLRHRWGLQALSAGGGGFGPIPHSLVAGASAAYVDFRTAPPQVARFDATTLAVVSVKLPATFGSAKGREVAADGSSIWVTDGVTLLRLAPVDLSSRGQTTLPIRVDDLWFGDGSLWGSSESEDVGVLRIDPGSGCATAKVAADAVQIGFSTHAVWLTATRGPMTLDPVSAQEIAAVPSQYVSDGSDSAIAVVGDEVWTVYYESGFQRIRTGETPTASP